MCGIVVCCGSGRSLAGRRDVGGGFESSSTRTRHPHPYAHTYTYTHALWSNRVRDLPNGAVEEMVKANIALYVCPSYPHRPQHPHACTYAYMPTPRTEEKKKKTQAQCPPYHQTPKTPHSSNWASLRRRFGADFSRGALGAMEELLGPTPLPRLPPAAVVDIYPIACFRGLDACRDAPAELLTLDDGQVGGSVVSDMCMYVGVHVLVDELVAQGLASN